MAANSSIILTNLDFEVLKSTFKSYMRSQDKYRDYDFEGSNINVLLDVLAYNTYLQSFYLNMVGNEMFLDSAQLRDSAVSHAKELNYTPQSFKSAVATVDVVFTDSNPYRRFVTIPKGTTFTSRVGANSYTFSTDQIIVTNQASLSANLSTFTANNVHLYEGEYINETFTISAGNPQRIIISNPNIDTSSLTMTVVEDLGATNLVYTRATSLFGLTALSQVFFLQGTFNDSYELVFGDGVIGRPPKDNSVVVISYRVSNGELPNGAFQFKPDGTIDGVSAITVNTLQAAQAGGVSESIDSIKYNAPRHFTTQERAITTEDYANLLRLNFPEINNVAAYGGEQLNPPQFGKVYVAVGINGVDNLPQSKIDEYYSFLLPRTPLSISPVFVNPEYMFLRCTGTVRYNINSTNLNVDDIRTLVISSIHNYATSNLNGFNKTLRYSKLVEAIDSSHTSVISNELLVHAVKYIKPLPGVPQNITTNFNIPILATTPDNNISRLEYTHSLESSPFQYGGSTCYLEDDGIGNVRLINIGVSQHRFIDNIGTINYETGVVNLINFAPDSYAGPYVKLYARPASRDIMSQQNVILSINPLDVDIQVEQVRE